MDSNLIKFENGICGYAPQGSTGSSGTDGYMLYYSPLDTRPSSIEQMVKYIESKKPIVEREEESADIVEYKNNDMIMTTDSHMLLIKIRNGNVSLSDMGMIKNVSEQGDGTNILAPDTQVQAQIKSTYTSYNIYNYVDGLTTDKLYHHRDMTDSSIYGNTIKLSWPTNLGTKINKMEGKCCKLVINFSNGLRFEKVLTSMTWNKDIFIDNRYFYPYGHSGDSSVWSSPAALQTWADEKSSTESANLKINLRSLWSNTKCLCDAYLCFFYNKQEYRVKVIIS